MPACTIKFASGIEGSPLWPKHYIKFFLQASLARPGGGVEPPPPGNDLPVNVIADALVLQFPHVLAQTSAAALLSVVEVISVTIVSLLEGANSDPSIKFRFLVVSACNFCFIDHTFNLTGPIEGASIYTPLAIAAGGRLVFWLVGNL